MPFAARLQALRKQVGLSQRDLAGRVNIDFTYLSKIETKNVKPPSEAVIRSLAHELAAKLGMDEVELSDELITMAGKIPSDLAQILADNPAALRFLRSLSKDASAENGTDG